MKLSIRKEGQDTLLNLLSLNQADYQQPTAELCCTGAANLPNEQGEP